jgi:hypothetical protein
MICRKWDPKSNNLGRIYFQKWILSNLTRNIQVLVYGAWEGVPGISNLFFTATYSMRKEALTPKVLEGIIDFVFVGTFSQEKKPLYAIQLIEKLHHKSMPYVADVW